MGLAIPPAEIPSNLTKLGFHNISEDSSYRLIVSTVAMEKTGKTHWALGVPGPVGVLSTDTGTEEVARKFLGSKKLILNNFKTAAELMEGDAKANEYEREWNRWTKSYQAIVEDRRIRSAVVDTATETWELCRLARFGKLTQVMPHHYGPVNAEFRTLVKQAYDRNDLNVVWIHKVKKEYKAISGKEKEVWSGKWERAGFGDMPYLVDVNLRHYFARDRKITKVVNGEAVEVPAPAFGIQVIDSRLEMLSVVGMELEAELCSFEMLAESCFPDTVSTNGKVGFWK
jgi:hypothetical protein